MNVIELIFSFPFRYFMRELVQHDAVVKPGLPIFLTSWVDKSSAQCMYTMAHTRVWSISHLKAGCWYIECLKTYCPAEEEVVKDACDRDDSRVGQVGSNRAEVEEEENEVDLSVLPEKERNRILAQRERVAKKAADKEEREAKKVADKEEREAARTAAKTLKETTTTAEKDGKKVGKPKAKSSPLHLTETSIASPSLSNRKRDYSVALLSASRLQQLASPSLMDSAGGTFHVQGFFFSGSLLSTDAYYVEHKAFPKEWMDMKAFLEMVCLSASLFNASCWNCTSFVMNFILIVACIVQYKSDKARAFRGVPRTGVDLMIVDIPEGLPVPMVSTPPTSVPAWNSEDVNFLPISFALGSTLVHDDGVLLLFHKDDLKLRALIRSTAKAYHFSMLKEWTGINRLPITSARDKSKTVRDYRFMLCFIPFNTSILNFYVANHITHFIHL